MKIAVASSDGKKVNVHFGMASEFRIYDVEGDKIELKETRRSRPWCGDDAEAKLEDDAIEKAASSLSDCEAVIVAQIGECAYDDLVDNNIFPYESTDSVDNAIKAYLNYRKAAGRTD